MDPSLQLVLLGVLLVAFAEMSRPWRAPNPFRRDDLVRYSGYQSRRYPALVFQYGGRLGYGLIGAGILLGVVRAAIWMLG
jgi:hypothetical protein